MSEQKIVCAKCGKEVGAFDSIRAGEREFCSEACYQNRSKSAGAKLLSGVDGKREIPSGLGLFLVVGAFIAMVWLCVRLVSGPPLPKEVIENADKPAVPSNSKAVSQKDFGEAWPLTVESGVLTCKEGAVFFTSPDGSIYAINGTAGNRGGRDLEPIWKPNPEIPGTRISIGPLIQAGLSLCN